VRADVNFIKAQARTGGRGRGRVALFSAIGPLDTGKAASSRPAGNVAVTVTVTVTVFHVTPHPRGTAVSCREAISQLVLSCPDDSFEVRRGRGRLIETSPALLFEIWRVEGLHLLATDRARGESS
jgi:hypothetical protein